MPAGGYWLLFTTLPSVKYLEENLVYNTMNNDKLLLMRFHDDMTTQDYDSILLLQIFEIYLNSETIMHRKVICSHNECKTTRCNMGIYLKLRDVSRTLFDKCLIYDSEYGVYDEYDTEEIHTRRPDFEHFRSVTIGSNNF